MILQKRDRLPVYGRIPGIPACDPPLLERYSAKGNHGKMVPGLQRKTGSFIPVVRGKMDACS